MVQGVVIHWCQSWGVIHFASAVAFFLCMALFCVLSFPEEREGRSTSSTKLDFAAQPSLDARQVRELATGRWIAHGDALLLLGPPDPAS